MKFVRHETGFNIWGFRLLKLSGQAYSPWETTPIYGSSQRLAYLQLSSLRVPVRENHSQDERGRTCPLHEGKRAAVLVVRNIVEQEVVGAGRWFMQGPQNDQSLIRRPIRLRFENLCIKQQHDFQANREFNHNCGVRIPRRSKPKNSASKTTSRLAKVQPGLNVRSGSPCPCQVHGRE